MDETRLVRICRRLAVAGIALLAITVCSRLVLSNSPYDTMQREASLSVLNITASLEIAWTIGSAAFAAFHWRITSPPSV
jgi:hypothetical protein